MSRDSMIKALRCLASHSPEGDCYHDVYNFCNIESGKKMVCGTKNLRDNEITCPYFQEDKKYGVCFEDGECSWLSEVADILETDTNWEEFANHLNQIIARKEKSAAKIAIVGKKKARELTRKINGMRKLQKEVDRNNRKKTIMDVLFETFPNAPKSAEGSPLDMCPVDVGYKDSPDCATTCTCLECWSQPYEVQNEQI